MISQTISHYKHSSKNSAAAGWVSFIKPTDTRLHRFVALKFLPDPTLPRMRRRWLAFEREAQRGVGLEPSQYLHHLRDRRTGRAGVYRHGVSRMGSTLRHLLNGSRLCRYERVLDTGNRDRRRTWMLPTAEGIVHRDIKPANIFVTKRGSSEDPGFWTGEANPRDRRR